MLDVLPCRCMSSSPVAAVSAPEVLCRPVASAPEITAHHRIRHEVFVLEQRLFAGSDLDGHDADPRTLHLIGLVDGVPAGTVRLWPRSERLWQGDRLAVVRQQRHVGLGGPLVRLAVSTAAELGGHRMIAQVQLQNVRFFKALGWSVEGAPADYLGVQHQQMTIGLR